MSASAEQGGRSVRYLDLVFEPDLLTAVRDDGAVLRLSRRERALLRALAERPQRLLTREQLLSALAPDDDELSDRKVDVTVNRLRRKLNDPARAPRFIATQYGEGYVWIAEAQPQDETRAFLVIGPVRGADLAGRAAGALLEALRDAFLQCAAPGRLILLRPDWRSDPANPSCRFSLEASFVAEAGQAAAALVLREEPTRQVLRSLRVSIVGPPDVSQVAAVLTGVIWRRVALGPPEAATPTDIPLQLRMQEAALLLGPAHDPWQENERRLAMARIHNPDDPAAALMWAMARFSRLLSNFGAVGADAATFGRIEEEIEGLALASLPAVRNDPILSLAAAQLLVWTRRGHMDFADELANAALSSSTAFAAALPVLAQILGWRGDLAGALRRLDEARALAAPGSEFEVYLVALRCRVLMASGDAAAFVAQVAELNRIKPATRTQLALPFLLPGDDALSSETRRRLSTMDAAQARAFLAFQYNMMARHFSRPEHVQNVMRGPLDHLVRRFGPTIVPEALGRKVGHSAGSDTGATVSS